MTKRQFEQQFNQRCLPGIKRLERDSGLKVTQANWKLREEHWNNFMKKMHSNQSISDSQFNSWKPSKDILKGLSRLNNA